jgi:hypothetical protein
MPRQEVKSDMQPLENDAAAAQQAASSAQSKYTRFWKVCMFTSFLNPNSTLSLTLILHNSLVNWPHTIFHHQFILFDTNR